MTLPQTSKTSVRMIPMCYCHRCDIRLISASVGESLTKPFEEDTRIVVETCKVCDTTWQFTFHKSDNRVDIEQVALKSMWGLMLVKRPEEDVYLVVEREISIVDGELYTDHDYYISTCPTNWLPAYAIVEDGDPAPCGVFELVKIITYADISNEFGFSRKELVNRASMQTECVVREVFPEVFSMGQTIDVVPSILIEGQS